MQDGEKTDDIIRQFKMFQEDYEAIGPVTGDQMLSYLQEIRDGVDQDTTIIFLNGAEKPFLRPCRAGYEKREERHAELNRLLEDFVRNNHNCHLIDVNEYLGDEDPYLDTINHYKKVVYFLQSM